MEDPVRRKQKVKLFKMICRSPRSVLNPFVSQALVKRISGSVERLAEVMAQINDELESVRPLERELEYVSEVWAGYDRKLQVGFASAGDGGPGAVAQ